MRRNGANSSTTSAAIRPCWQLSAPNWRPPRRKFLKWETSARPRLSKLQPTSSPQQRLKLWPKIVEALAEAHALLDSNGIELRKLALALHANAARSPVADMKIPCMLSGDFEPRFSLKNMFKDMQLALNIAAENGLELPAAAAFAGAAMAGIHQGWGDSDFSVISRFYGFPGQGHVLPASEESADAASPLQKPSKAWSLFRGKN